MLKTYKNTRKSFLRKKNIVAFKCTTDELRN